MKKILWIIFIVMVVAQWGVPLKLIIEQEWVLTDGAIFRFKTKPIDPTDPFRGNYIRLDFEANQFTTDTTIKYKAKENIFVSIEDDYNGFAKVVGISKEKPISKNYILAQNATSCYTYNYEGKQIITIEYPFEKYYVEESKASEAERAYWNANRDTTKATYALVRVKDGRAAISDLIINGKPIRDLLKPDLKNK